MKFSVAFAILACMRFAAASSFGPNGCVSLSLSQQGSCVFQTQCAGQDISKVEFNFDCESSTGEYQRHSFGVGGFEEEEEFDTDVKCAQCVATTKPPQRKHVEVSKRPKHVEVTDAVVAAAAASTEKATVSTAKRQAEQSVVSYGPGKCVSTWRDSNSSTCIVKTACSKQDTSDYTFGLVCKGKSGTSVRHLFGKNSFAADEEFDTLIECNECLALDKVPATADADTALESQVNKLAAEVGEIKDSVKVLSTDVEKLNEKTGISKEAKTEKKDEKKESSEKKNEDKKESSEKDDKSEKKDDGEKKDEKKEDSEKSKSFVHTKAVKKLKKGDSKKTFLHSDNADESAKAAEGHGNSQDADEDDDDEDDHNSDRAANDDQDTDSGDDSSD